MSPTWRAWRAWWRLCGPDHKIRVRCTRRGTLGWSVLNCSLAQPHSLFLTNVPAGHSKQRSGLVVAAGGCRRLPPPAANLPPRPRHYFAAPPFELAACAKRAASYETSAEARGGVSRILLTELHGPRPTQRNAVASYPMWRWISEGYYARRAAAQAVRGGPHQLCPRFSFHQAPRAPPLPSQK